jgi:flagellar assembly protein FliH
VKQNWVNPAETDTVRLIDSNDLVELRMKEYEAAAAQKESHPAEGDAEFVEGLSAETLEAPEETSPDDILTQAHAEAERIIEEAKENAKALETEASAKVQELYEHQKTLGYEEGIANAEDSVAVKKAQLETQLNQQMAQNEEEYKKRLDDLEPELVDAIISVFDHVFGIQFENKRDILLYLVKNTISHVDAGKHFRIRTTTKTSSFLEEHLDELQKVAGYDAVIELLRDDSLADDACKIDTDYGLFDCSLDTELKNLYKDIRCLCN